MISKINHIGIAVRSLDNAVPLYRDVFKFQYLGTEEVADQKVRVAMFRIGEVKIELLEPLSEDSPIAVFIEKSGEGIHHIAYQTDDIKEEIKDFVSRGLKMINQEPRKGAHETEIAFVHPKSTGRILTELCQIKGETHE
ncbi:methylmalonyl-CoA epimerase [bacterium]|nr:methylmalonyl-CoA epimerase [bacterium]